MSSLVPKLRQNCLVLVVLLIVHFATCMSIIDITKGLNSEKIIYICEHQHDSNFDTLQAMASQNQYSVQYIDDTMLASQVLNIEIPKQSMILLDKFSLKSMRSLLDGFPQLIFLNNYFIIVMSGKSDEQISMFFDHLFDQMLKKLPINTVMFLVQMKRTKVFQVLWNARNKPTLQECKFIGATCSFKKALDFVQNRTDHGGQVVRLSYELWFPKLVLNKEGNPDGIMPRAARAIGKMYNMTIDFQKVRDPIGGRLRNGTWIGDLGDVQRGVIDGSAWGWIYSLDRHEAADFTYAVVRYHFVLAARRPLSDDITFRNYVGQFIPRTWLFVLLLYGGFFLFLALLLSSDKGMHFTNWSLLSATSSTIFRVVLNKPSTLNPKALSAKCGVLTFFASGMLLLIAYRAIFNAFLSIKLHTIPYSTWDDVLRSDARVILPMGHYINEQFMLSPRGTVFKDIYDEKINGWPTWDDLNGKDGVKGQLLGGNAVYYGEVIWLLMDQSYPCSIMDISSFQTKIYGAFVLQKESPYYDAFQRGVLELIFNGLIDRWDKQFDLKKKSFDDCDTTKTTLGFSQTFFPFGCLGLGIGLAILFAIIESTPTLIKHRKKTTSNDELLEDLLMRLKQKKYCLSKSQIRGIQDILK